MKKVSFLKIALMLSIFVGVLSSCEKDSSLSEDSVLDTSEKPKNALDQRLYDNYTVPYNIAVYYKWEPYKVSYNRYLFPPDPNNVEKVMNVVKKVWIDSYTELTRPDFIYDYSPKEFVLVGGRNMNPDNATETLGLADQGERVVLFIVDLIDVHNVASVRQFIHTIQHEYVHILNQTKPFNKMTYGALTPSGYNANWSNYGEVESLNAGFISSYSRSNVGEDFAEMSATMLVDINAYNAKVDGISNETGKKAIRTKEAMVVEYYKDQWGIDFYELCEITDRNTTEVVQ